MKRIRTALCGVLLFALPMACRAGGVLEPEQFKNYVERFNADDREVVAQAFPNTRAWEFLAANMPLFECPDKELELTYYFRWWTFRKHLKQTPDGWVITEFLPAVPWAGKHNTINCAAGHHIREGRWLADRKFIGDYIGWWLRNGGQVRRYSFWVADSVLAWCDVIGDYALAKEWLPDLLKNYESWEKEKLDVPTGMFWQWDRADGMERSIGKGGFRPTINSYQYGDALAIARIAEMCGKVELARIYRDKAARIKNLVQARLWNEEQQFFEVRKSPCGLGLFKWLLNDDAALTRAAKVSSSAPGPVNNLNDGVVPKASSNWKVSHFTFDNHVGTHEWVQYDLVTPTQVSSMSLYLMTGGKYMMPESYRVLFRQDGVWKVAQDVKGTLAEKNQWNKITFFPVQVDAVRLEVTLAGADSAFVNVRELIGYVPWYFDLPDPKFSVAWRQLADTNGFAAPWGLTTAERRHPEFKISCDDHDCLWNGPVWPFATAQTLTALANLLNGCPQDVVNRGTYFEALSTYAHSQRLKRADGKVVPWIDEDQNPFTGDWIARAIHLETERTFSADSTKKKNWITERGKDYNHSTFCDLVINGLVGLRPRGDDTVEVNPLVPPEAWDWFCLDRVPYHGRLLTILWDKTGKKYGRGAGLRVLADGKEIASSATLKRISGGMP
jgi:hypothetical protein